MVDLLTAVVGGSLVLAGLALCWAAATAWRLREAPASDQFAVVASVAGLGALMVAATVVLDPTSTVFAAVLVGFLLPVPWLLFTFEYTGRGDPRTDEWIAVVAAPLAVGMAAAMVVFGTRVLPGLSLPSREAANGLTAVAVYMLTISEWITLLYAGGLMLVGAGALLWTFDRYEHLDSTSGALLGVFGTAPWLTLLFGFQVSSIAPLALPAAIAVGFVVGAAAVTVVLRRRQLFQVLPAAGNIGPSTVIEELSDLVVVTDREETVVELNRAVESALDVPRTEMVGGDVAELLGHSLEELRRVDSVDLRSSRGRQLFDPTVSDLTDQHDLCLGHAVILRDVTARTIRQQRLEVLNRVLRHNFRNDATVLMANAQRLTDAVDDPAMVESAETIIDTTGGLIDLSESARDIERLLATADAESSEVRLATLVRKELQSVADGATAEGDVPPDLVVTTSRKLLKTVMRELTENALGHNDADAPRVEVRASYDPDDSHPLTVRVFDNGPGIPDHEREAVLEGDETPLRHGTGLGLWLVRWAVIRLGGELDISDNEPRGTVVSLRLPRAERRDSPQ